ncbi:MAG TPA: hypothetical protein VMU84_05110 [Thermoanaerobaculia bacterium]|nr:hypothetical protein [Thermoanaerobaculia bacterium]
MQEQTPETAVPRVERIVLYENLTAEIHFADGGEVVWSGELAADLRSIVQSAIRRGFARAKRSRASLKETLAAMPDVGSDDDFERIQDHGRAVVL